jgi:hypothetical protein
MATSTGFKTFVSSEDVHRTGVYSLTKEKIGEIDHLMIDKVSGRVVYAIMSFGGFLGLGHSHYPLPWGALKYDASVGGYVTSVTREQLCDAPAYSATAGRAGIGSARCIATIICALTGRSQA